MADADEITTPAEAKHTLVKLVQELHRVLSALRGMDAPVHDFTLDAMQETIGDRLVKDLKNFTASYNRQIAKRDELTVLINALTSTQIAVLQTQLDAATNALTAEQDRHIATTQASQVKDQLLLRERTALGPVGRSNSTSGLLVTDALTRPRVTEDSVTNHQTDHATTTQDPAVERTAQGDPRAGDKRPQDSRDTRLSSPEQSRSASRTIFDHATTDNDAVTASGYVSPNDPSLRKGYVVIKVSTYALLHVSIVQDLSERRDQHGVQV
ncbi:hypothetical protein D6C99_09783 [Aureobasidium pullulans]|uniref:Uncharacterized protein n=1 Tax=Aureobasidium pullulans TaxID=5580 RepID=A0A4S9AW87_AURPU|nr:hypothetical protein D6D15_08935 [Aureobasidium pullulans]THX88603.1 hypothetical protein D6D08_03963 [Aureobasidium pullulans]THY37286.1 hypothetical protein D6C99_09783 [Aureobasidium pullulans]